MLLQLAFTLTLLAHPGPLVTVDSTRADLRKVEPTKPWLAKIPVSPLHHRWWQELARCQKLKPFSERVRGLDMYAVNTRTILRGNLAVTMAQFHQLYFVVRRVNNEALVKHEMLHQLLYWNGLEWETHDARFQRCGAEVDFDPI